MKNIVGQQPQFQYFRTRSPILIRELWSRAGCKASDRQGYGPFQRIRLHRDAQRRRSRERNGQPERKIRGRKDGNGDRGTAKRRTGIWQPQSGWKGRRWLNPKVRSIACTPAAVVTGHAGAVMIDFESEMPFVHWTTDALNLKGSHQTVELAAWHHSPTLSYTIADSYVTFEAPAEWGEGSSQVRLQRTSGGIYECHSQSTWFRGVRAETGTHVIMTGWWSTVRAGGTGIFIGVWLFRTTVQEGYNRRGPDRCGIANSDQNLLRDRWPGVGQWLPPFVRSSACRSVPYDL